MNDTSLGSDVNWNSISSQLECNVKVKKSTTKVMS